MIQSINNRMWSPWHAVMATLTLLVFTVVWSVQVALANEERVVGRIVAMPADGLVGEWQVADFTFVTSGATEFRQEKGDFAIGRCVEVEYASVASQIVATKVATKSSDDCTRDGTPTVTAEPSETVTPDPNTTEAATPEPSATHGDDDGFKVLAQIDTMPEGTLRGLWTIGGLQYEVGPQARLRQKDGPFRVDACVELRYRGTAAPFTLLRMETERISRCQRDATPTPGSTIPAPTTTPSPSRTPDDDDSTEIYGILDSFPPELIGEWSIAGERYTATTATEFEQKRGVFAVGSCVKAHLSTRDATLIREVETTNRYRCGGGDSGGQAHGELYGVIQEFPAELIGDWQIGGTTVTADAATEFKQRSTAFAQGITVKVHFMVLADGTFYATEIETKFANDHHGDGNGNDIFEGAEGHAYGLIEDLPTDVIGNLLGNWVVAGISYTVTSDTQIVQPHSDFAVGRLVRMKYRTDGDGNRIARQIKTTRDNGGTSHESHATFYGFVNEMPANGFVGKWLIGDASFQATTLTKFKEDHGLLGLGSYVKLEYRTIGDQNVLHEIESQVPPGAGDDSNMGEIEAMVDDSDSSQSATAAFATVVTWTISGQQYVVTAATDLNDFQGALEVGQQAFINSYTAADGTQVATQIRGVTLAYELFLPVVNQE